MAAKKTAAMIHQARTRAASSVKSFSGFARRSENTATDAATSTPNTSSPARVNDDKLAAQLAISTVLCSQLSERATHAIQTGQHCECRSDCKYPGPGSQKKWSKERRQSERTDHKSAVAFAHRAVVASRRSERASEHSAEFGEHGANC